MKSRVVVLWSALALLALLPMMFLTAAAEGDLPAYVRYVWKISETTTIYQDNGDGTRTANGTIAAGTYVRIDHTFEGQDDHVKYASIVAMDGTKGEVPTAKLVSAMVWIGNDSYHELYLKEHGMPDASGDMPHDPEVSAASSGRASESGSQTTGVQNRAASRVPAGNAAIALKAKLRSVSGNETPEEMLVTFVYAPISGKASLREAADNDSKTLAQCSAGTVVTVLEVGKIHTLVDVNGQVGYLRNDCLRYTVLPQEQRLQGTLVGGGNINVRGGADKESARIAQWPAGTQVTVYGVDGNWCEVEYDGLHGWVASKYVVANE